MKKLNLRQLASLSFRLLIVTGVLVTYQNCGGNFETVGINSLIEEPIEDVDLGMGEASAELSWDKNTEADLAGYRVYIREENGTYGQGIDVGKANSVGARVAFTVEGLEANKTYYFAVSAYDLNGMESELSGEVMKDMDGI